MLVRDATDVDLQRVVAVHEAAVRDVVERSVVAGAATSTDASSGSRRYDRRQVLAWNRDRNPGDYAVGDEDRPTVVAVHNGAVVGFGMIDVPAAEVHAVYVHPDHQGVGVGSALLAHLEGRAVRRGVATLSLLATLNAVPFYDALGYDRVDETVVEREAGADQPVVRMETRLRHPAGEDWGRLPV